METEEGTSRENTEFWLSFIHSVIEQRGGGLEKESWKIFNPILIKNY